MLYYLFHRVFITAAVMKSHDESSQHIFVQLPPSRWDVVALSPYLFKLLWLEAYS